MFPNKIEVDYCTGTLSKVDADGCTALYTISDHYASTRSITVANLTVTHPGADVPAKPTTVIPSKDFGQHALHSSQPPAPHTSWSAA